MVDFNNEATVGTPAIDIVRVLILQRHNDLIEAIEHINKMDGNEMAEDLAIMRSRMFSLYLQISGTLKRHYKPEQIEQLRKILETGNKAQIIEELLSINDVLDKIKLTRIDTKIIYDSTSAEAENEIKNL